MPDIKDTTQEVIVLFFHSLIERSLRQKESIQNQILIFPHLAYK